MGTLPNLTIEIGGRRYGGAYWNEADYTVTFTATPGNPLVTVTTENSSGQVLGTVSLSPENQDALIKNHTCTDPVLDGLSDIPGLARTTVWQLGDDTNDVALIESNMDEIVEWLRYSTGELDWDGGPDWEY